MSQLAIIKRAGEDVVIAEAKKAIAIKKQIDKLNKEFESSKLVLREKANGETMDISIEGHGSIQVKTPVAPSSGTSLNFDEEAYKRLSLSDRTKLLNLGVVNKVLWANKGAVAAVTVTPNK